MAILKIVTYPDKFLQKPTLPVGDIDDNLQHVIEDMAQTMYAAPGIGLAAIQVGIDRSFIVYDICAREGSRLLEVLINPKIIDAQGSTLSENEGCLSVPDFRADVKRHAAVLVDGFDRHGKPVRFEAEGLAAIMLQHEIDHLEGKLFIDRISKLKRELYKRRIEKQLKNSECNDD